MIKNNIKSFIHDNIRVATFVVTMLLCTYHIYEFIQIDNPICLLRVAMYFLLSLTVVMFNLEVVYIILIVMALIASHFNHFLNYTSFFVLLLACRMNRRSEKMLLLIYGVNEAIALHIQDRTIIDLLTHLTTCTFFYLIYFFVNRPKVLELKEDEEQIIKEMAEGKLQKEITLYSKNIVKEKLDHAKVRNKILSTDELITIYRQSHPQSQK